MNKAGILHETIFLHTNQKTFLYSKRGFKWLISRERRNSVGFLEELIFVSHVPKCFNLDGHLIKSLWIDLAFITISLKGWVNSLPVFEATLVTFTDIFFLSLGAL